MKNTQTISDWTNRFASVVKADRSGSSVEASNEVIEQIRAKLTKADDRIATLQSELKKKQASVSALLVDDVRSSEELAELKEMVWTSHRGLTEGCKCNICVEVERSRTELEGLPETYPSTSSVKERAPAP